MYILVAVILYLYSTVAVLCMTTQFHRFYFQIFFFFSHQHLFTPFDITAAKELTLGGDMLLSDLKRLQWNYAHEDADQATGKTGK